MALDVAPGHKQNTKRPPRNPLARSIFSQHVHFRRWFTSFNIWNTRVYITVMPMINWWWYDDDDDGDVFLFGSVNFVGIPIGISNNVLPLKILAKESWGETLGGFAPNICLCVPPESCVFEHIEKWPPRTLHIWNPPILQKDIVTKLRVLSYE